MLYPFPYLNKHPFCRQHKKTAAPSPSPIQTILSAPESHRNQLLSSRARKINFHFRRSGITPCPEDESILCYDSIVNEKKHFVNFAVYKMLTLLISVPGGRFPRAWLQPPHFASLRCGVFSSCYSRRSRRLPLQSTKYPTIHNVL